MCTYASANTESVNCNSSQGVPRNGQAGLFAFRGLLLIEHLSPLARGYRISGSNQNGRRFVTGYQRRWTFTLRSLIEKVDSRPDVASSDQLEVPCQRGLYGLLFQQSSCLSTYYRPSGRLASDKSLDSTQRRPRQNVSGSWTLSNASTDSPVTASL